MNENISIKEGGITRKFSPIDKVKVNNTEWIATSELDTSPLTKPIPFGKLIHRTGTYHSGGRYWEHHTWISGGEAEIAYGSNNFHYMIASSQPGSYTTEIYSFTIDDKEEDEQSSSSSDELGQTYTANGKTVYYAVGTNLFVALKNAELYPTVNAYFYNSSHLGEIAWTMIYGNITEEVSAQSIWMPKDDMRTGTLYATENGIYIATKDGYDAYDKVVVRVTDDSEWGEIYPDNDYGRWDEETLDDYLLDPDGFDETFNDPAKWDDPSEDLDYTYGEDGITGIDPDTGNEAMVNLDENGFLNEEVLPSSISITKLPNKLTYKDGETISFSGIEVTAYTEDGNVWTNSKYPNGIIPMSELIFPVKIADASQATEEKRTSGLVDEPFSLGSPTGYCKFKSGGTTYEYNLSFITDAPLITGFKKQGISGVGVRAIVATDDQTDTLCYQYRVKATRGGISDETITTETPSIANNTYTYKNKTVYYTSITHTIQSHNYETDVPFQSDSTEAIAWTMMYGDVIGGTQTIPVEWNRYGDGLTLEDSFEITVSPGSGNSGLNFGGNSGG